MPVQTITTAGGEVLVVLSLDKYKDLIDARDANLAAYQLATGQLETFSEQEVRALLAAPTRLAFWREHRGIAPEALAKAAGMSQAALAELEAGTAVADRQTYAALAEHLRTEVEDITPDPRSEAPQARAAE
jgi:hypothetical protein